MKSGIDDIQTILNLIEKQQAELEKKDKQIDLMAEYIGKEDVSEIFCDEKIQCDENCKSCVKQYFEKKVL